MSRRKRAKNAPADPKKKARQASKLAEIHQILNAAGFDTAAKQAAALHLSRSTAWAFLHCNKRAGPSSVILKRLLASKIPPLVREKIYEYIEEKRHGLYGHHEQICKRFGAKCHTQRPVKNRPCKSLCVPKIRFCNIGREARRERAVK
jgi:hypothetical protein